MCLAVPMKIVAIEGEWGTAELNGIRRQIGLQLLDKTKINDWVMIHAGFAISKVTAGEAKKTLNLLLEGGFLETLP